MFDFPNAPTNGQQVQGGAGQIYAWDGVKWAAQMPPGPLPVSQGGTGAVTLPVTVPGGPGPPALTGAFLLGHDANPVTPASTTTSIIGSTASPGANLNLVSAVNGASNVFQFWRATGTLAAPGPITNGIPLGVIYFGGYDGTWWYPYMAQISVSPTEDWSGTKHGTTMSFYITKTGTNNTSVGMTLDGNGALNLKAAAPSLVLNDSSGNNLNSIMFQRNNGATDQKRWEIFSVSDGRFIIRAINDAYSASTDAISITRAASGTGVAGIGFAGMLNGPQISLSYPGNFSTNTWALEIQGSGGQEATIALHRPSAYATLFGLGANNHIMIGGWSVGTGRFDFDPGSGNLWVAGVYGNGSDVSTKTDIVPLSHGLAAIKRLEPKKYRRRHSKGDKPPFAPVKDMPVELGLVAQDVQQVLPEVVMVQEETGLLGLQINAIVAVMINGIKELTSRVEALEAR